MSNNVDTKDAKDTTDTKDIKDLLGNTTDYIAGLTSGNEVDDNPDGKTVEKYFSMKLKVQLKAENIYSNIKISISELLDDINVYLPIKTFENNNLSNKVAKTILQQFNNYFENEADIEIDLLIPNVIGSKIDSFFKLIGKYSYPEQISINPEINYLVIVESTYCLKKNIIKKAEQLRKLILLFSRLNKLYQVYKDYLEDFYEYFIKKRLLYELSFKNIKINGYKKDKSFKLSNFDNFIILFASNSQIKIFQDVSNKMNKISLLKEIEKEIGIGTDILKCFRFPYDPKKEIVNDKKKFSNEKDENEHESSNPKKKKEKELLDNSYRQFEYLIEKVNEEGNLKVKLIYLDLYLNVIAPKSEIIKQIDDLKNIILSNEEKITQTNNKLTQTNNELIRTNNELTRTNNELNNKLTQTNDEMLKMKNTIKALVEHIRKNNPDFNIDDMK